MVLFIRPLTTHKKKLLQIINDVSYKRNYIFVFLTRLTIKLTSLNGHWTITKPGKWTYIENETS